MPHYTVYQKPSCISCKKALAMFTAKGAAFTTVDITKSAPPLAVLQQMIKTYGIKGAMNTRSAIYKAHGLGQNLPDEKRLLDLMAEDANLIKRPVILKDEDLVPFIGFDEVALGEWLNA